MGDNLNKGDAPVELPTHVFIPGLAVPLSGSATTAITINSPTLSPLSSYRTQTAAAINDKFLYDVVLAPGTWQMDIYYVKSTNAGVITPTLDGTDLATLDSYNASVIAGTQSWTGISVVTGGLKRLQLQAKFKNVSSSNYFMIIAAIVFTKTA